MIAIRLVIALVLLIALRIDTAHAYNHTKLKVNFLEHRAESFALAKKENKPIFILLSAQWCHWCKIFEHKTLADKRVYSFMNERFINLFVDADINSDLVAKYKVSLLPYVVLLFPDGTLFQKFGGALYADDFYGLITGLYGPLVKGSKGGAAKIESDVYAPPAALAPLAFDTLKEAYMEAVADHMDEELFGLGREFKALTPMTFLYLLKNYKGKSGAQRLKWIKDTLEKATDFIFDPIEGGYFRYAESRDWTTPHYEKMLDKNSGAILILARVMEKSPSKKLKIALHKTIGYLSNTLFDESIGAFLNFQVADTSYYKLNTKLRAQQKPPVVAQKIFTDKFAKSIYFLLEAWPFIEDVAFKAKIRRSINFMAKMARRGELYHYYVVSGSQWSTPGKLADYAFASLMFSKAACTFGDDEYKTIAKSLLSESIRKYYDKKRGVFFAEPDSSVTDVEYIMELNSALIISLGLSQAPGTHWALIKEKTLIWFSGVHELFANKVWDAKDFRFMEKYALLLIAAGDSP